MGQPGAKKTDQITSLTPGDVHIIMVPSPGGPVPTPIPHPCTSIIKDNVADKVKVMGLAGAVKGSVSKHTPPHVPMGPGPFQKPPANKGEIITASSNVEYQSKAAAMLGDTAKMCCDPSDAPVGKVMGTAATVLVGGGGGGSDADRAAAAAAALAAAMAAAAQAQLLLAAMTGTGHPIDVGTGQLVITAEDLALDSPLPIQFVRTYLSGRSAAAGPMGHGWVHNFQEQIELVDPDHAEWPRINSAYVAAGNPSPTDRYVIYRDGNGVAAQYHAPAPDREVSDMVCRRRIGSDGSAVWVVDRRGKHTRFVAPAGARNRRILLPLEARDRNDNRTRFRYDAAGRLREVQDCYDRRVLLTYSVEGRIVELGLQESAEHPIRRWCTYHYDSAGDLIEVVDVAGASTQFRCLDHLIVEDRNRDGYSFYFAYDAERRCVKTWGQDGFLTRHLSYDPLRQRTREVNGEGETTIYHLTPQGAVKRIEKGAEGVVTDETTFDDAARPVSRSRFGAVTLSVAYDADGNVAELIDADQHSTTFTHNAFGQVTSMVGPAGDKEEFRYDARGNMVERRFADGGVTRYERDSRGRTVVEDGPNGRLVLTEYDAFGNLRTRGDGVRVTAITADALGNVLKVSAPGLPPIVFERDVHGRMTQTTTGEYVTERVEYSPEGFRIAHLDSRGVLHRYLYGGPGVVTQYSCHAVPWSARRAEAAKSGGGELLLRIRYERDTEGRPRSATDSLGRTRTFSFDARGGVRSVTSSEGQLVEFGRDYRDLITSIRAAGGVEERFEFDSRGHVTRARYGDGLNEMFDWDEQGRLAAAVNPSVDLTYEYDTAGRQIIRRQGDFELSADVDAVGGTVTWTMPDGPSRQYRVDAGGRTRAIAFGERKFKVERDAAGAIRSLAYPNGVTQAFAQDPYGRLTATRVESAARGGKRPRQQPQEIYRQHVTYRSIDGQVAYVDDTRDGRRHYRYDRRNRLASIEAAGTASAVAVTAASPEHAEEAEHYRFDDHDNVVASRRFSDARTSGDQLLAAGAREYTYDARGCVATIRDGERVWQFEHDAKAQVTRVDLPDGGRVDYRYDALGRRIEKAFTGGARDGRIVRFFWDVDNPVKEEHWHRDGNDSEDPEAPALERFYLFNGVTALARIDRDAAGERALYFHNDYTGRPRLCTDDRGRIAWQWTGDSFGASVESGALEQNIRLPGQYFDEETGLSYNRHRYYDPHVCRYLQPDPIVRPTDVSRYAYPTDPLSRIDPLGLSTQVIITDWRDPVLNGGYVDQSGIANTPGYKGEFEGNASRLHFKHGGELPKYMHDAQPPDLTGVTHVVITGHGGLEGMEIREPDGTTRIVQADEMADYLKGKGLTPENGVQVTLVSCHTGAPRPDGGSFASDLAQALGPGAVVHAPTNYAGVMANGDVEVLNGGTMEQFVYQAPPTPTPASTQITQRMAAVTPPEEDEDTTQRMAAPPVHDPADDEDTLVTEPPTQRQIRPAPPGPQGDNDVDDPPAEPPVEAPTRRETRAAPPGPQGDNDVDDPPIDPPVEAPTQKETRAAPPGPHNDNDTDDPPIDPPPPGSGGGTGGSNNGST